MPRRRLVPVEGSAVGPAPAPRKGVRPNLEGVPGEIVSLEGLALVFGQRLRISPYDALLDQLAKVTEEALAAKRPRPGLKFGDLRAKAAVMQRARKKGLRISFAEFGSELYVRLDGRVDDDTLEARRAAIRKMLANGVAMTYLQIANKLRADGDATIDAGTVDTIMLQLMKAGEVVRQEGGAWKLSPVRKAG